MGRSLKKGPFVDEHLMKKVEAAQGSDKKSSDQNLVSSFNNFPKLCWTNNCCI